jgi:hypothetical protein
MESWVQEQRMFISAKYEMKELINTVNEKR